MGLANGDLELVRGGGGGGTRLALANCSSSAFLSGTGGFCPGTNPCGSVGKLGCSWSDTWSLAIGGEVSVSELDGYECNLRKVPPWVDGSTAVVGTSVPGMGPLEESMLPFLPMSEMQGGRPTVDDDAPTASPLLPDLPNSESIVDEPCCCCCCCPVWPNCELGLENVCSSSSRASSAFSGRC